MFLRWGSRPASAFLLEASPLPVKASGTVFSVSQGLGRNLRMDRTPWRTCQWEGSGTESWSGAWPGLSSLWKEEDRDESKSRTRAPSAAKALAKRPT